MTEKYKILTILNFVFWSWLVETVSNKRMKSTATGRVLCLLAGIVNEQKYCFVCRSDVIFVYVKRNMLHDAGIRTECKNRARSLSEPSNIF
jgi:hypothetical protein